MDTYKSKYEKYKNKYLTLKSTLTSANDGAGEQPQLIGNKKFIRDLMPFTFQ